ncbi:MAG: hypothetical protein M9953_09355 [Thermomicrobiales bacterium]|nr:hypothetical protein [Thermomicrobiales bacterium]MCO5217676.1 hypothetical protein [Thermomicrobiales bacterium]MCO5225532.1 hypothetical protein [Thermomicrobiales bacterium]MCO5228184.1 hypothetical protein [Thermomicrobiales bacterium]
MIQHPIQRKRETEARNRVALEVILFIYAVGATITIVRILMLVLGVTDRVWIGRIVFGSTALLTDAMARVPGFGHTIIGPMTMVDLIMLAAILLFPLGLLATSPRP